MKSTVVSRTSELAAAERFLDAAAEGPTALVLSGPAGIGKTTVWAEAVARAEARGYSVLSSRPSEAEAKLSYAAVTDLIDTAFDEVRSRLPAPQEQALLVALLRSTDDEQTELRTVATGFAGVLSLLAEERPLVIAIDDVQWLDGASRQALEFAVRRLDGPIGVLVAERAEEVGEASLGLTRALGEERIQHVVVEPLSVATLHHLLRDRLDVSLSRPQLTRIAAASAGNPFFALELGRTLVREGGARVEAPLSVPQTLQDLVASRLEVLSAAAREAALVVAASSAPTAALVRSAGVAESALREVEASGVVVSERNRLRFAHPLLGSVVYGSVPESRRRDLHRALGEVVSDPEERARHLARAVSDADEPVARAVELGAERAAARGARDAAAELYAAAVRLTPPGNDDAAARRLLGGAAALNALGDFGQARALGEHALESAVDPSLRVEILSFLAGRAWFAGAAGDAVALLEQALDSSDPEAAGPLYARLARFNFSRDVERAVHCADEALEILREELRPALVAHVLIDRFIGAAMLGRGAEVALLQRALALEQAAYPQLPDGPQPMVLLWHRCVDDIEAARARFAFDDAWCRVRGEEVWAADRLSHLAVAELHAGHFDLAEQYAESACAAIESLDLHGPLAMMLEKRALVDAHRGRTERARATLLALLERFGAAGQRWWEALTLSTLAVVEFAEGDDRAVDETLRRMHAAAGETGVVENIFDRSEPFHVESLLALGDLDGARVALERLERRHAALPRPWTAAALPRTRALVRAADGDLTAALALLEDALGGDTELLPFERACTLLARGRLSRRAKQKRAAAEALRGALELFEHLGAQPWAERARAELDRVGLRRRSPTDLTATERKVAELAASGLTNRQVAESAFMSPKTVEANLARAYRKLGIRSRAELGARLALEARDAGAQT